MQKRIDRMSKLIELAAKELEESTRVFQSLQQQLSSEQSQLSQLRNYLDEYIQRQTSGVGSTLQQLKSTNAFMDKLNQAIEHQKTVIEETESSVHQARENWVEKRAREQALIKLNEKLKSDHQKRLDKQEQKLLDELSGRHFSLD